MSEKRRAGYLIVYTPFAKLYKDEPRADKIDMGSEAIMRERWPDVVRPDPYYDANLSRERADFSLGNKRFYKIDMNKGETNLWTGVSDEARNALTARDYKAGSLAQRVAHSGIDAGELVVAVRSRPEIKRVWIPGVEIFSRTIHSQRHRGAFGEFVRRDEGVLAKIGFWPKQWSAARMFADSAKGFHVHPPSIPPDTTAEKWLRRLFVFRPENYSLRRYDDEQWDVMFFLQGRAEMILCDVRAGLSKRIMRLFVDGDNHRSSNNVGLVIPPGVAHAIRAEGSEDVLMVYGTSTIFTPEFEGRIASEIETAELPESWQKFLL